jgi:hypothetical protein
VEVDFLAVGINGSSGAEARIMRMIFRHNSRACRKKQGAELRRCFFPKTVQDSTFEMNAGSSSVDGSSTRRACFLLWGEPGRYSTGLCFFPQAVKPCPLKAVLLLSL